MGKIWTSFYGDAQLDNDVLTLATKQYVSLKENDTYQVYDSAMGLFREDFWIKHLATQQGKANLVYQDIDVDYTVTFPTSDTIKATFSNGKVIQGKLPANASKTRFIEMSYSVISEKTTTKVDKDGNETTITEYSYSYGYYDYQEGSGNSILDNIIKNNGISGTATFFPVIPVRTNTAWFGGTDAYWISQILDKLHIYDNSKTKVTDAYESLKSTLTTGIGQGSLGDIDYMTVILGVAINTRNTADQHYLFEFFYNVYTNYAVATGNIPQKQGNGFPLDTRSGNLKGFWSKVFSKLKLSKGYASGFTSFNIYNGKSNLNLTYDWAHADYYSANGKWKPNAKVNTYGVLAGIYNHTYTEWVPKRDSEGNIISHYDESTGRTEIEYELETYTIQINETLFCHQLSENRYEFVMFAGLGLTNLVYHGKTVYTDAYEAVKDSNSHRTLRYQFDDNPDGTYDKYVLYNFTYVENPGDSMSAFIVPLEQKTFYELSIKDEMDISYGCEYLICNCWVKKKVRWYQHGWLGTIVAVVCLVVSYFFPPLGIILIPVAAVLLTAKILELTQKLMCMIFGERLGTKIFNFVIQLIKTILLVVASICFKIPVIGWIIWAICIAIYTVITVAQYLNAGYSLGQAFKKGLVEGAIAGVASLAGGALAGASGAAATAGSAAGTAVSNGASVGMGIASGTASALGTTAGAASAAVAVGANTSLQAMNNGVSTGKALGQGAIAGGAMFLGSQAGQFVGNSFGGVGTNLGAYGSAITTGAVSGFVSGFGNALLDGENIGTALREGGINAAVGGLTGAAQVASVQVAKYFGWGKYGMTPAELEAKGQWDLTAPPTDSAGNHTGLQGTIDTLSQIQKNNSMGSWEAFKEYGWDTIKGLMQEVAWPIALQTLENPMTYGKLLVAAYADQQYHKMANMLNDYEEFNNKYKAAEKVLNMLNQMNNSTVTAEFVCFMQSILGRMQYQFSDMASMSPESWLSLATTSGHDQLKSVLAGPSTFVDAKLTVDGYEPYQLYYTQMDFDLMFTETSTTL